MRKIFFSFLMLLLFGTYPGWLSPAPNGGEVFLKECASCHGDKAQGDRSKDAPRLADRPVWELLWQLDRFLKNERPTSDKDVSGHAMKNALGNVKDGATVKAVVEFLGALKTPALSENHSGDAKRGENLYALCSACHGTKGEGNESLKAPRLAGVEAWYLTAQLNKFRSGHRGNSPGDALGYPMALMAQQLADEKAVQDVVAYIRGLKP